MQASLRPFRICLCRHIAVINRPALAAVLSSVSRLIYVLHVSRSDWECLIEDSMTDNALHDWIPSLVLVVHNDSLARVVTVAPLLRRTRYP